MRFAIVAFIVSIGSHLLIFLIIIRIFKMLSFGIVGTKNFNSVCTLVVVLNIFAIILLILTTIIL